MQVQWACFVVKAQPGLIHQLTDHHFLFLVCFCSRSYDLSALNRVAMVQPGLILHASFSIVYVPIHVDVSVDLTPTLVVCG